MNKNKPDGQEVSPSVGAVVSHASRLLTQALAEAQKALPLAPAQYRVLIELWQTEGLTQQALVQKLDIEQPTVGSTINRMERDGLVQRKPHPRDGRSQVICLTEKAKKLKGPATKAANNINQTALLDFSEAEKNQLFEFLDRIIGRLKKKDL